MIKGIGTDIIEISRITQAIKRSPHFLKKVFTQQEIEQNPKMQSLSGNFATKEALSKAFGTGFREFSFQDIEVLRDKLGKPYVNLYGNAKLLAQKQNITNINISISHCKDYAISFVIIE
ncbi:holo-[acyl-carrier-protein] synthase [Candidatus Epulonipiscium fishelsonii]|uniref:Holo-[acyl-carrier-protein] synthase n=1 Tax=Candidatus Epulonipiscium fishelsonii TaxID=77094 RepID=A0ACC8XGG9_9FIRM|nr:holo-[acyl-carrier-protein] synthase [Epulopiscium sp. SCG-B05WGA-EpuloA1]ONI42611.1 holo-[acyl-carrier-protein] synthase [Epulopiscium sp. SCG-B11WGA-EpuloA1]